MKENSLPLVDKKINLHNYFSDDIDINMKSYILYIVYLLTAYLLTILIVKRQRRVLNTFVKISGGARHYKQI